MFYYEVYLVKILIQPNLLGAGHAYLDLLIASHFFHALDQFNEFLYFAQCGRYSYASRKDESLIQ